MYPLLKDTDVRAAAAKTTGSEPPEMGRQGDRFIVPVGPQHPALKEPGHFEFAVDGELVTGATVRLGYVHRGIERACEQQSYTQNLYLTERVCGICSHSHATYVTAWKLAKIWRPRIRPSASSSHVWADHSHYLWLGVDHEAG
jgi:NADH-quinone oxidoreductase subunit D